MQASYGVNEVQAGGWKDVEVDGRGRPAKCMHEENLLHEACCSSPKLLLAEFGPLLKTEEAVSNSLLS